MILEVMFTLDIRGVWTDDRHPGVLFTACAGGCLKPGCWFRYVGDHVPGPHGIVIGLIDKSSWLVMPLQ